MKKYGTVTSIERERRGLWMMESVYDWVAYCYYEEVSQARTKKECIKQAKERGYIVPTYVLY